MQRGLWKSNFHSSTIVRRNTAIRTPSFQNVVHMKRYSTPIPEEKPPTSDSPPSNSQPIKRIRKFRQERLEEMHPQTYALNVMAKIEEERKQNLVNVVKKVVREAVTSNKKPKITVFNALLNHLRKKQNLTAMLQVMDLIKKLEVQPDALTYNCLISAASPDLNLMWKYYSEMKLRKIDPDDFTLKSFYPVLIQKRDVAKLKTLLDEGGIVFKMNAGMTMDQLRDAFDIFMQAQENKYVYMIATDMAIKGVNVWEFCLEYMKRKGTTDQLLATIVALTNLELAIPTAEKLFEELIDKQLKIGEVKKAISNTAILQSQGSLPDDTNFFGRILQPYLDNKEFDKFLDLMGEVSAKRGVINYELFEKAMDALIASREYSKMSEFLIESRRQKVAIPEEYIQSLIDKFINENQFELALRMVEELRRTGYLISESRVEQLIDILVKNNRPWDLVQLMKEAKIVGIHMKDEVFTSAVIKLLGFRGNNDVIIQFFEDRRKQGMKIEEALYTLAMEKLLSRGDLDHVLKIMEMKRLDGYLIGVPVFESLITGLMRVGQGDVAFLTLKEATLQKRAISPLIGMALFSFFLKKLQYDKCLLVLEEIHAQGSTPNKEGFHILINTHAERGDVDNMMKAYKSMRKCGQILDSDTFNIMMNLLNLTKQSGPMMLLVQDLKDQGITLNKEAVQKLTDKYTEEGNLDHIKEMIEQLKAQNVKPSDDVISKAMEATIKSRDVNMMSSIFQDIQKLGGWFSASHLESLSNALSKQNKTEDLLKVLEQQKLQKLPVNITYVKLILDGLVKKGDYNQVWKIMEEMKGARISWDKDFFYRFTDLLVTKGEVTILLKVLAEMRSHGFTPKEYVIHQCAEYCRKTGDEQILVLYEEALKAQIPLFVALFNSIISVLGRKGKLEQMAKIYDQMKIHKIKPDLMTFSELIYALSKKGDLNAMMLVADDLQKFGIRSDIKNFNSLLETSATEKDFEQMVALYELMKRVGTKPDSTTLNLLINSLKENMIYLKQLQQSNQTEELKKQLNKVTSMRTIMDEVRKVVHA